MLVFLYKLDEKLYELFSLRMKFANAKHSGEQIFLKNSIKCTFR